MIITRYWKRNTKQAEYMIREALLNNEATIWDKYQKPSNNKVRAYNAIKNEYRFNDTMYLGIPCKTVKVPSILCKLNNTMYLKYRDDIGVVNASSHFFTTIASFQDIETNEIYIIKETHCNTYMCKLVDENL